MKYIIFSLASLFVFSACKSKTTETAPENQANHTGVIHLDPDQIKRAGVTWAPAEQKTINMVLLLTGELRIQPENRAVVSAPADGFITSLRVRLNETVRKGEVIAALRKPDLLDVQQSFLENRDRIQFLQSEYTRYNALRADDATAVKNVQKARAELNAAVITGDMLAAKLKLYGIDAQNLTTANVRSELTIVAPLSGVVTAVHLSNGSAVQAGSPICEIADFSALHADLFVFEKDMLKIKTGQKVDITFPGAPDKKVKATLFSMDRTLDPEKNAVRAHARIDDSAGLTLVDGAYCDARLALENAAAAPALLSEAIVREGLEEYIVVLDHEENGNAYFKPVKVEALGSEGGFTAFRTETPLSAQALIVQKGAYFVWAQGKVEEFGEEH